MKMLNLVCILWGMALLLTVSTAFSQPPDSLWSRTYGGSGNEGCHSIQQTSDSGYILAGWTTSFGAGYFDFWLVKTNANGDSLWSRTFGGESDDGPHTVRQTSDSGYILAGPTNSFGMGMSDFWLVKTNAEGDCLWSRTFGGSFNEVCYDLQQTSDGGYILAGCGPSFDAGSYDFWLVKTDSLGYSLWSRTFEGGLGQEVCRSVQQTSDGGYILAGYTTSFGTGTPDSANFWLVKTDADGDSLWSRVFGGKRDEHCRSVQQTPDGGYILAGFTESYGAGGRDFWLLKTDSDGDSLWSRTFGGPGGDDCYSGQQTLDGGYALAGETNSFGAGANDFWLVKTVPERPYYVTVYPLWFGNREPVVRWIAPFACDYKIYSTTNPNHQGDPPGGDWTLEDTIYVPAGPAYWEDPADPIVPYKNYVVVTSCP